MLEAEHIEDWRGQEVHDTHGESLGKLDEVFFDARTGVPVLVSIKSGLLGRHSSLVPLADATVGRDYIRLGYAKSTIDNVDASELPISDHDLARLGDAYGLRFREQLQLESATELESRAAEAEAARRHAEELEAAAREKHEQHQAADQRAQAANVDADETARDAAQAQRDAAAARAEAERYDIR